MIENLTVTDLLEIERLDIFIKTCGYSRHQFEEKAGLSNGYISRQLNRRGSISSYVLKKIVLAFPELNLTWLITGYRHIIPRNANPYIARMNT